MSAVIFRVGDDSDDIANQNQYPQPDKKLDENKIGEHQAVSGFGVRFLHDLELFGRPDSLKRTQDQDVRQHAEFVGQ